MNIGDNIKNKRAELNLSQTELAGLIGVAKQTLYKYENGIITNIPSDKIEALSTSLNTTPAYLMGWEDETPPAVSSEGSLDEELITRLCQLTPEELVRVDVFVQGILASH